MVFESLEILLLSDISWKLSLAALIMKHLNRIYSFYPQLFYLV